MKICAQWFMVKMKDALRRASQRSILGLVLYGDLISNMDDRRERGHIRKTQTWKTLSTLKD